MSSRVRLARNLAGCAFPGWAKKGDRVRVCESIRSAAQELPEMQGAYVESMEALSGLDKQILVERHLVSKELAAGKSGAAVISRDQTCSVMVNEEDHLRIQMRKNCGRRRVRQIVGRHEHCLD